MAAEHWPTPALLNHLRRCRVDEALGYTVWTIEAAFPPESTMPELKPRVGRVFASIFNKGVEVRLNEETARRFLALLSLTGAACESWVTSYDDPPDSADDPGFEIKNSDGQTIITAPAYAGRLWTLGNVGDVDPDIRVADWSQADVGSVNFYISPHGAFQHVL